MDVDCSYGDGGHRQQLGTGGRTAGVGWLVLRGGGHLCWVCIH